MTAPDGRAIGDWLVPGPRLGEGAFGVVYEAYDRRRKIRVALKTLRQFSPAALLPFKREFRSMADLVHPNLVTLYDLVADGEQWCFTMELVEGGTLVDRLRALAAPAEDLADGEWANAAGAEVGARRRLDAAAAKSVRLPPIERVRDAFAQLAEGVCALHAAGILHRDLKPSNVLVGRDGRVVILDFGLATSLASGDPEEGTDFAGTPQYMAPEQLACAGVSAASDWYSVGVVLFEALAGQAPFHGTPADMFARKQRQPPPALREEAPDVPADLDALCRDLLNPDPRARPTGREVLRRLRGGGDVALPATAGVLVGLRSFVGRERDLEALREAFAAVRQGRSVTVCLQGRSGMGKTALAQHFLAELPEREGELVLLEGRCYEQESVPYKALDSLVDSLSRYLKRLPAVEVGRLLPPNVLDLARLFPVLREVEALATVRQARVDIASAQELRRRAATALRELFARIAAEHPLVLYIDDLQWGDLDSGVLLNEIVRPPDPPALLLLVCCRSEDAQRSPLPRLLRESRTAGTSGGELVECEIGELSPDDARALARALLSEEEAADLARAEAIAHESGGHPFFLTELTRALDAPAAAVGETSLEQMIQARVARLPAAAHQMLEVIAVAGQPLDLRVAHAAIGFDAEEDPAVRLLRGARLVRTHQTGERSEIETYHDRIRETVTAALGVEGRRSYHERLALTLERMGDGDAETLAVHFREAGHAGRAAGYAVRAAEQAAEALAFDRAARLYEQALGLVSREPWEERALRVKLADALANAGRGGAAGEAYLAAADGAAAGEALELRRRAAQQLLISGHTDEGLAALQDVLRVLHIRIARTPKRALFSLLARRARLAVRGLGFRERPASAISPDVLMRIDSGWAATIGLGIVDPMRAADFQLRHLLTALDAGEPYRIARALAMSIGYSSGRGKRTRRRAERLCDLTERLAEQVGHPHTHGLAILQRVVATNLFGHFQEAVNLCDRAEPILREQCTGATWELDTVHLFRLHSLAWMGAYRELTVRAWALLKEAQDRGDLYLTTYIRARIRYLLRLAADDAQTAADEQRTSLDAWSRTGFHLQHYWDWFASGEIELYAGRARAAWERIHGRWRDYGRSFLHHHQAIHVETVFLRARVALTLAAAPGTPPREAARLVAQAARDTREITRERVHWGDALALLLQAGLAATRGERAAAIDLAAAAERTLGAADMGHYAAAARRRRGEMIGGEEGQGLIESADAWMREQTIRNPRRMTAMLLPGAWEEVP